MPPQSGQRRTPMLGSGSLLRCFSVKIIKTLHSKIYTMIQNWYTGGKGKRVFSPLLQILSGSHNDLTLSFIVLWTPVVITTKIQYIPTDISLLDAWATSSWLLSCLQHVIFALTREVHTMTDQVARSTYKNKQDEIRRAIQLEEELYNNLFELVLFSDLN